MISKIFFIIIILPCFFWASNAQAIKHAIFPEQQSLQPAPLEVKNKIPRIDLLEMQNNTNQIYNENIIQNENIKKIINNTNEIKKEFNFNILYWILDFLLIFLFFIILIIKKIKKSL